MHTDSCGVLGWQCERDHYTLTTKQPGNTGQMLSVHLLLRLDKELPEVVTATVLGCQRLAQSLARGKRPAAGVSRPRLLWTGQ